MIDLFADFFLHLLIFSFLRIILLRLSKDNKLCALCSDVGELCHESLIACWVLEAGLDHSYDLLRLLLILSESLFALL